MSSDRPHNPRDRREPGIRPAPDTDVIPPDDPEGLEPPVAASGDVADLNPRPDPARPPMMASDQPNAPQSPEPSFRGLWIGASVLAVLFVVAAVVSL